MEEIDVFADLLLERGREILISKVVLLEFCALLGQCYVPSALSCCDHMCSNAIR
jgi:hypothetical protein